MPGGRPSEYNPEFCERVVAFGKEGMSRVEIASELDCGYNTFLRWQDENPEFRTSVLEAERYAQAWWEKKGRIATFDSDGFSAVSYQFNMKNRFRDDWRDKVETENKTTLEVQSLSQVLDDIAKGK